MTDSEPTNERTADTDETHRQAPIDRSVAEAQRYRRIAAEDPDRIVADRTRVFNLLTMEGAETLPALQAELKRRAAVSDALETVAIETPTQLTGCCAILLPELNREQDRSLPAGRPTLESLSDAITDRLVSTIARIFVDTPDVAVSCDGFTTFVDAVTTDQRDTTLRVAMHALFLTAQDRSRDIVRAIETIEELLTDSDPAIQTWSIATVGRLATTHPGKITPTAETLGALLDHTDDRIQHNAVEALAELASTQPDAVLPATESLVELLDHDDVAIQHNTAGIFGQLAEDHPDAVLPAVEALHRLREHDDAAVRRVATGTLVRLVEEHPEIVDDP
ncbi:MAG: hypothetical protein SVG88_11765 [Halobacteriales archaeon]|nr:hypothetical protein [Halobacteriales archaeon]